MGCDTKVGKANGDRKESSFLIFMPTVWNWTKAVQRGFEGFWLVIDFR